MKTLVLNGSPKPNSDTMVLTNEFLRGFNNNNEHSVEIIDVIKKEIKPCRGCFGCWARGDGRCVQSDDQNELLEKWLAADAIILSFPLYCYGMPSHIKAVIDRLLPLTKMNMKTQDGRILHETTSDLSDKKFIVISGCGFPNFANNFAALEIMCKNLFGEMAALIFVPETPLLNQPAAEPLTTPLKSRFFAAGKEFSDNLIISSETIAELTQPMLNNETYINIVNSQAGNK